MFNGDNNVTGAAEALAGALSHVGSPDTLATAARALAKLTARANANQIKRLVDG